MVFSSILFLFRFMPVAFTVYYLTPKKLKNLSLLILSLFFYSWGEAKYFPIMLSCILVNFFVSIAIEEWRENRRLTKTLFVLSVVFNLGMLGFFKYTNFFISNINGLFGFSLPYMNLVLPLGISFYTFQTMAYTIDVYLGKVKTERNIIDFGAFVVLFPQLIAGPIVKYTDISAELKERTHTLEKIEEGVRIFIFGLGSKVLLANNIGQLWSEVERLGFANVSTPLAWLGILAYAFQIYFDFSGYSLMAIGLGKMMAFEFPQNFNFPYISRSFTEFWRRWHMTLGSWFREYVYIPMGGNRVSTGRLYWNLFVVWGATGFWHGANWNFVLWGLFFFVLLVVEKMGFMRFLEKHRIFSHCYVILLLLVSWALFAITDFGALGVFLGRLFAFVPGTDWVYYLRNFGVTLLLCGVFSTPALKGFYLRHRENLLFSMLWFGGIVVLSTAYLVDATYNPFLYFRF